MTPEPLKLGFFNCLLWRLDAPRAVGFQYHGHCLGQQAEKELFPDLLTLLLGWGSVRLEVLSHPTGTQ